MPNRKRAESSPTTKKVRKKKPLIKVPDLPTINWPELEDKINDIILEQAPKVLPGPEKMALAVDSAAKWLDAQIDFTSLGIGLVGVALESADGMVAKLILKGLVQKSYDQLKIDGVVR